MVLSHLPLSSKLVNYEVFADSVCCTTAYLEQVHTMRYLFQGQTWLISVTCWDEAVVSSSSVSGSTELSPECRQNQLQNQRMQEVGRPRENHVECTVYQNKANKGAAFCIRDKDRRGATNQQQLTTQ